MENYYIIKSEFRYFNSFIFSYFIGSIPFGLILSKVFLKKDIRKLGSGNIGATNVLRAGTKLLAGLTLFLMLLKDLLLFILLNNLIQN